MNKFKKSIALLLVAVIILSSGNFAIGEKTDISNHWAKQEIQYLMGRGIINGYPDGTFRPEKNITKAEFYKVINELIGYEEKAKIKFDDVKESDWFYEHIQKGVKANYIKEGKILKPNANITREEVAEILSIVFDIEENLEAAKKFKDYNSIPKGLRGVFGGLADKKYLNGYPDGIVKPKGEIKRSEVVKMFYNISGKIINLAGRYTEDTDGNVLVNTYNVVLKDMNIKGDLYLTEGIGEGDATLDNVIVEGKTYIKGGGENSIIIINSKLGEIIVKKEYSNIRVVIDENTDVSNLVINENTILVIKKGAKIESLKVTGKASIEVEKGSEVGKIEIESKDVEIKAEGNIGSVVSTEDVKINDKVVEKGKAVKIDGGNVKDIKEETKPTPGTTPPGLTPDPDPKPVAVNAINISPETMELTVGGATKTITATVLPDTATNKNVTWTSSDNAVATVVNGVVTPKTAGTTTITAKTVDGGFAKTILVTVKVAPVTLDNIAITTPATKTVYTVGESLDITGMVVTGTYSDSSTKTETITVENVTGFNSSAAVASQTLTITVDGKTTTYTVDIKAVEKVATPVVTTSKTNATNRETGVTFSVGPVDAVTFYYTIDGSTPTSLSEKYTGAVTLTAPGNDAVATRTIKVIGIKADATYSDVATATVTYAAKDAVTYLVTVSGGTGNGNFAEGATINITADAPVAGKVFDMWTSSDVETFANANNASTTFVMPAKAVTVTATYKNINYTISYVLYSGTNSASNPATYTIETDNITLADATRADYTFEGWYKETGFINKVTQIAKGSTGNMTLYAKWTAVPVLGTLSPTVTPDDDKVFLSAMTAEAEYAFYYKQTATSDAANKPALDSTNLAGWIIFTSNTDIAGTNGTPIFVQVIKVSTGGKIKAWGEASAIPADVPVTGVTLDQATMNLKIGAGTGTLKATIAPANASNKNVTWSSDNTAVATVDNTGKVMPVAVGTVTITVTTTDGSETATCTVTVTAANIATSVFVNGNKELNKSYPFLVNGERSATGELGSGGCTAYFDQLTGVVILKNYDGKGISSQSLGESDLIIKLIGTNKVNEDRISSQNSGDIYITAENEANLIVNSTSSVTSWAIATGHISGNYAGSIVIGGKAKVTVSSSSGGINTAYGLYAYDNVSIQEDAHFTATSISSINSGDGIFAQKKLTINTTGDINIDCSNSQNGLCIFSTLDIKHVNLMTLKAPILGGFIFGSPDLSGVAVNINTEAKLASYRSGKPYTINALNGVIDSTSVLGGVSDSSGTHEALENDEITIKSNTIDLFKFDKWTKLSGSELNSSLFTAGNANTSEFKIKMPAENLSIKSNYKSTIFTTQPKFHRGDGKITWEISQTADYNGQLQWNNGESWSERNYLNIIGKEAGPGTSEINVVTAPDDTYRLMFNIGSGSVGFKQHYSEEFEIKWNAQLEGTVTFTGIPKFGETLTANAIGIQADAGALKYQWFAGETKIAGAIENTLELKAEQIGKTIKVEVSSHNYNTPIIKEVAGIVSKADGPAAIADFAGVFTAAGTSIQLTGLGASTKNLEAAVAIDGSTYSGYSDLTVDADGKSMITGLTAVIAASKVKVRIKATATQLSGTEKIGNLTLEALTLGEPIVIPNLSVGLNVEVGATIIASLTATGGNGTYTYSLEGTDASKFAINASTGQVQVKDAALTVGTYNIIVKVTDGIGSTVTKNVEISVAAAPLSSENSIISFTIADQLGASIIDSSVHTVAIKVANDAVVNSLIASFTLSAKATVAVNGVAQESGTTANDFSAPVSYIVKAENGVTQAWVVTVTPGEPDIAVTATGTALTKPREADTTIITLSQAIEGLQANDIKVYLDGYEITSLTKIVSDDKKVITIDFPASTYLEYGKVVTVKITKSGYSVNGGVAIVIPNGILGYKLTLVDGTIVSTGLNSGTYSKGANVAIKADVKSGMTFNKWEYSLMPIDWHNGIETDAERTIKIPEGNVTLTATYLEKKIEIDDKTYTFLGGVPAPALPIGLTWDDTSNTLTMNGFQGNYIKQDTLKDITLNIVGENKLITGNREAILVDNTIVKGTGTLTLESNYFRGVYRHMTIEGNATVKINMLNVKSYSNRIAGLDGNLTVKEKGKLFVTINPNEAEAKRIVYGANTIKLIGKDAEVTVDIAGTTGKNLTVYIDDIIPKLIGNQVTAGSSHYDKAPYKVQATLKGTDESIASPMTMAYTVASDVNTIGTVLEEGIDVILKGYEGINLIFEMYSDAGFSSLITSKTLSVGENTIYVKRTNRTPKYYKITVIKDSDIAINNAAIPGVVVPVTGATPDTNPIDATQYTGTVTWSPGDNPFKVDTQYTATIILTPKTGFKLDEVVANFFKVDGATVTNAANSGTVTAVFSKTTALSSDATLTSSVGTVDNTAGTIVDVPNATTLAVFKAAITPAAGAIFKVYKADGTTEATNLASGYKVIVTAQDTTTKKTYTVTVKVGDFAAGTGTKSDPYLVSSAEELNNVRNYLNQGKIYFKQTQNINLGVAPWNTGVGWIPIGTNNETQRFKGIYDGNEKIISGLTINRPSTDNQGLFGGVTFGDYINSELKNISLTGVNIKGYNYVGGLVGFFNNGAISNCSVSGSIMGNVDIGGLTGRNNFGTISSSHTTGTVTGTSNVGGLVGYLAKGTDEKNATIEKSYSTSSVLGQNYLIGGLVGTNLGKIKTSYATGEVKGTGTSPYDIGGLTGKNEGKIENSYSMGEVSGNYQIGGLAGKQTNSGTINNSYAIGKVTGNTNTGGLVGKNEAAEGSISLSYYDTTTSGQSDTGKGVPKTTTEMKTATTFTGWDTAIWNMTDGNYPTIK